MKYSLFVYLFWITLSASIKHCISGIRGTGWLLCLVISVTGGLKGELWAQVNVSTPVTLTKLVDKPIANRGDQLTYKLIVTNTGSSSVSNIVVRDSSATGLRYVTDSAVFPTGTTFTHSSSTSLWTVATLSAGNSLTLTFQAVADSSGILYNQATIPGDTAIACTSIPVHVCTGDQYTFRLTAAPGRSSYKWFKDNAEISGQTANVLDVTTPGSYSLAVDNVADRCPDFSCCSFVVIEDALPAYQARAVSADCATPSQSAGKIILSDFTPTHTYQYSAGTTFDAAASLSGAPKTIPASGLLVDNLANPASDASYTIRVYNGADCYIDQTVTLRPSACCSLIVTALAGPCAAATNSYSSTIVVSLTNPSAGTLTVTDGPSSMTFATTTTGSAAFTAVFSDLISNTATHPVTVSLPGCSTASTTYTAPASCSVCVNPVVTIANGSQTICTDGSSQPFVASVVSGTATAYAWYGPLSSTTATLGTALPGQTGATYQPDGGQLPGTYYYALLTLGNPASCSSVTFASLTVSPLPSAGANQTLVCSNGAAPTSTTLAATGVPGGVWSASPGNPASVSFSSGNALNTSVSGLTVPGTYTFVFTSPASCTSSVTVAVPDCPVDVALSVTDPGTCQPATNSYTTTGIISLTNAVAGTALITDDTLTTAVSITAGQPSATYSLTGLTSGTGSHTVTVTYANKTASTTYTAPSSCSVAPVCSVSATAKAVPVTCTGANPKTNGQLVVSSFKPTYSYQYALGATFNENASLSGPAQPIPTGGVLISNLANPASTQPYTIRVYDGVTCYTDITVPLPPTVCTCPPAGCVPLLVRRIR